MRNREGILAIAATEASREFGGLFCPQRNPALSHIRFESGL
jgi:hypothetical protein